MTYGQFVQIINMPAVLVLLFLVVLAVILWVGDRITRSR